MNVRRSVLPATIRVANMRWYALLGMLALIFAPLSAAPTAFAGTEDDSFVIAAIQGDEGAFVLGTDGRYVVWETYTRASADSPFVRAIYAADLVDGSVTLVTPDSWTFDSFQRPAFNAGIVIWGQDSGTTDTDGNPLIVVIAHDLATGEQVELAHDALCCASVQPDGRVTWYADGGYWMRDPGSDAPATLVWPNTEFTTHFIGLVDDWAIGLQIIEAEGKYGYYEHVQLIARGISTGDSRVLDDGWKWYDTSTTIGITGENIAYPRLYPTPEDAERAGDWLAVTTLDGAAPVSFQRPAACFNTNIRVVGDSRFLLLKCRTEPEIGGADLWVTDLANSKAFTLTLNDEFPVWPGYGGGLLAWTDLLPDGSPAVVGQMIDDLLPEQEWAYFAETGAHLKYGFRSFWEANGSLPVFGYPLTEEYLTRNRDTGAVYTTQITERQRFEWHPENAGTPYEVLLGRLGAEVLIHQERDWTTLPTGDPTAPHYFPETGHAIAPEFWEYWSSHGLDLGDPGLTFRESLGLFGYPLSEPMIEPNNEGAEVLSQYFERAVFEYHPDNPELYRVLLRRLGAEFLTARGW